MVFGGGVAIRKVNLIFSPLAARYANFGCYCERSKFAVISTKLVERANLPLLEMHIYMKIAPLEGAGQTEGLSDQGQASLAQFILSKADILPAMRNKTIR